MCRGNTVLHSGSSLAFCELKWQIDIAGLNNDMTYNRTFIYIPKYEYTGTNQHGDRYKEIDSKQVNVVKMSTKTDDAEGLTRLILLSDRLNVPVRYSFKDHTASIEVMSAEDR
jgi:hypothetical protein